MKTQYRGVFAFLISLLLATGATGAELPPGLVRLAEIAPGIRQEMRYAGPHNFVGRPIDGYETADCWLLQAAAEALARAAAGAEAFGWRLVVYDCYRPERAVADFALWSRTPESEEMKAEFYPGIDKALLFEQGFIAARSQHSRGTTVDLGAEVLDGGAAVPLDFGTPFDTFAPESATASDRISEAARRNRMALVFLLEAEGFDNYRKEWWHFTLPIDPAPPSWDYPITD
jgi:zinc D-Ala-D-Ala dipeptidase